MKYNSPEITYQNKIHWPQVIALLMLNVAVIISWIAYHEFQPEVIKQFGFSSIALEFTIIQGFIVIITPAVAGYIADKQREKSGKKMPIINVGINVVSMIFMAVALSVFIQPGGIARYIVPILIVGWLISMNIFRSPAISLIEQFVPQNKLPAILALFVVSFDIAYAIEPVIVDVLTFLGGPVTFLVGGILIFSTGFYLRKSFTKVKNVVLTDAYNNDTKDGKSNFLLVVLLAVILGGATSYIFKIIPTQIQTIFNLVETEAKSYVSVMVIFSAVLALFIAKKVQPNFIKNYAILGVVLLLLAIAVISLINYKPIILVVALIIPFGYALLSVTALPMAFYALSSRQTVFGLGIFYGCAEIGDSIFEIMEAGLLLP